MAKSKNVPVLPLDRSGIMRPEYKQWRDSVAKPRVRKYIRELPYPVGYLERVQIEDLAETEFIGKALTNVIIATLMQAKQSGDVELLGTLKDLNTQRLQYMKAAKELRSSLLMTPASKQGAILSQNRNDAFAVLGEARRQILNRFRETSELPAPVSEQ